MTGKDALILYMQTMFPQERNFAVAFAEVQAMQKVVDAVQRETLVAMAGVLDKLVPGVNERLVAMKAEADGALDAFLTVLRTEPPAPAAPSRETYLNPHQDPRDSRTEPVHTERCCFCGEEITGDQGMVVQGIMTAHAGCVEQSGAR